MKISDLLKLSTDNLRRRKGRTALTVIGVVVGTCAIVVMISSASPPTGARTRCCLLGAI